jgi:predicted NAD/FAD-binding protein
MAGVSLAWLLDGARDVVLLEARESLGGNVQSIPVEVDGEMCVVDMGAQYFHPGPYPTFVKLLALLGLLREVHSFPASITLDSPGEQTPRFVSPVLPNRVTPLLTPWNRAGLQAFGACFMAAKKREEEGGSWNLTLQDWLPTLGLSSDQWEGMLLPWAASLFSGSVEQTRGLSARAAMIFVAKALPGNLAEPFLYYVLKPGMAEVLRRMTEQFATVQVLAGAAVTQITRGVQGGFVIKYGNGQHLPVHDLVFASSGPSSLELLKQLPGTDAQQAALQRIQFVDARLMLHSDPVYARADSTNWSFVNAEVRDGHCDASMWLEQVLAIPPPDTAAKLWKSWVTHRTHLPSKILYQAQFRHMLPTPTSLNSQTSLLTFQGQGNLWFAGGYLKPYDSQETALVSALEIAQGMLVDSTRAHALRNGLNSSLTTKARLRLKPARP